MSDSLFNVERDFLDNFVHKAACCRKMTASSIGTWGQKQKDPIGTFGVQEYVGAPCPYWDPTIGCVLCDPKNLRTIHVEFSTKKKLF